MMTFNGLLKGKGFTRFMIDLDNSSPVKKSMVIDTPNKTIKIKQKIPNIFIIIMHSPHTMILIYYLYRECYYPFFCIMFQQYTNNEIINQQLPHIFDCFHFRRIHMGFWSRQTKKRKNDKNKKQQTKMEKLEELAGTAFDIPYEQLKQSLEENIDYLKKVTGNSPDILYREIEIGKRYTIKSTIVTTLGLVDTQLINDFILNSLMTQPFHEKIEEYIKEKVRQEDDKLTNSSAELILTEIEKKLLPISHVKRVSNWSAIFKYLLTGKAVIFLDGAKSALITSTQGGEQRSITEPQKEVSIFGPKDSFTESIVTNISLIRKRIRNPNLWVESFTIGKVSQTDIRIMYINGIANEEIVEEVRQRLNKIDIDQILDASFLQQFIQDKVFTSFPTIYYTERPDVVTANLMEGRVAIFVDGSPFALTVPALFLEFFQSVDDYYARFDIIIFLRFLRIALFFIAMILPATYVAITTFHQEMAPTLLIIAIAAQREAVPFPAYFEALLMEITFEVLREAGSRLPRAIGQAVSIVGALVIGQAAIQANIVSPAMVIIVSLTAISNFAIPSFDMAIATRIIRFILMTLAAVMGIYGIVCGLMFMCIHLNSLRSFGVPYMEPFAPVTVRSLGDTVVRLPLMYHKYRPKMIAKKNTKRVSAVNSEQQSDKGKNKNSEKG